MANVILKSLKFTKILNGRLSFSSMKPYYGRYFIRSYKETKQTKAYTTAAYKLEPNEDLILKNSVSYSNVVSKDNLSLDDNLSKIDSVVRRIGRIQMKIVHKAFSSVISKDMASSTHALYFIRSCKYCSDEPPSKRIELVNQIWNRYQELGLEFDVRHYNSLLDVHISNGFNFNPAEILASMEDVNIQPNKSTYLLLMKKYCQDGNIAGASEILEYMKREGISADENVFNYLIEGHIKNNDFTGAKDMLEVMRSSSLHPNDDTFSTLACGYAAVGKKDEMMSCLKECKDENNIQPYLKAIHVLATSENHEYIDEVFSMIHNKKKYREEFINSAVELIHKNQSNVAYKLICAAWSPINNESTNIFIKQLIRAEMPASTVINFCECICNEDLNNNIYLIAQKFAAESGLIDCTVSLLKKMIEKGYYIRSSSFRPLLTSLCEKESHKDIWSVLKIMFDLGVPADYMTYFETIYPLLGIPKPEDIIHNVKASGQILQTAADALFVYYCNLGEIDYAADLIQLFPVSVGSKLDVDLFLSNCVNLNKESRNKYLKVLKHIFSENDGNLVNSAVKGKLLSELVIKRINILEDLLRKFEDLSFSPKVLNICERAVSRKNPAKEAFVKKLKRISLERESIFMKENMSVQEENDCIKHLQDQNIACGSFLAKRLNYHIKTKNVARVTELQALFEKLSLTYSPIIFANLLLMHCTAGDVEKAMETAHKLQNDFPDFKLDLSKLLDYINILVKYEKFEESISALKYFLKERYNCANKDIVLRSAKRLIMSLSDVTDTEFIKKMQNMLLDLSDEIGSESLFLEPLIHHHLYRGDLTSAFDEFKNILVKYHVPVGLNALFKRCIILEDKNTLQRVIDLTRGYTRKSVVLLELAVAFVETFNIQKAIQIIEDLGREISPKDLEDICMRLCQQNKHVVLEELLYITKSLNYVDRENLYMYAFRACANKNDHMRAEKLFAVLKKEIPELKPETISYVKSLLQRSDQHFHKKVEASSENNIPQEALEATKGFIENLEAGNIEAALVELNALKKGYIRTLSLKTLSSLVDLCLQKNCTKDLSLNVHTMSYIIDNSKDVLKPLIEKYSAEGDIDKFVGISQFIPDFSLMNIGYNTYFCKAHINSGKHEELLSHLEQRVNTKNKLFCQTAFDELLKFPQYEERIFNLAVKYLDLNYPVPMAVLWSHYFLKENFEKAEEIFKKYPFQVDKIDVIVKQIKESENVTVALKYVDFVKPLTVRLRLKQRAYGTAVTLLVAQGKYDEAVNLVVDSEKHDLFLHKYYMTPLITLKNALEKENKPVPFSIPLDIASDSE